jgi:hypothetical protein
MAMQYFDVPPGMKVYTLNICEAVSSHGSNTKHPSLVADPSRSAQISGPQKDVASYTAIAR